jgi:poly-gamma-glutamate synthesis protein (capsule biosynthesis protein)
MTLTTRLLIFGATLLAVLTATLLASSGLGTSPRSPGSSSGSASRAPGDACRQNCDLHQIVWVGDILLGDRAQAYLDRYGYQWPFGRIRHLLVGDVVIGNAEGPITARREKHFPDEQFDYNAEPPAARALADVGFDALGLSNNHALDRGPEGLQDTLRYTREAGIRTFGAGMNDDEAAAPLLVETAYGAVAVVGMGQAWSSGAVAGPGQAGTVPFSDETIARLKQSATTAGARWVVAYVHWGENYSRVTPEQRRLAATFARAGYDLVVGAHPHVAQEVDLVDGMPVLYSLGNFTFGSPGRYSREFPGFSVVARTYLGRDGFQAIELTCIVTDNEIVEFQPRPCSSDQSRALMRRLGSRVTFKGERGVVEWRTGQGPGPGSRAPAPSITDRPPESGMSAR